MECKICSNSMVDSPDEMVICNHNEGPVHLGCCMSLCSEDGNPCEHCKAVYSKLTG